MRWCSFTTASGGPARLGAVAAWDDSGKVLDVGAWARSRDAETPADLVDLVMSSTATQKRVTELVRSAPADGLGWIRKEEVRILAPLREPNSIRSLTPVSEERVPTHAQLNRRAVAGNGEDIVWPSYTQQLVYSAGVGAVVGRRGRNLTSVEAQDNVFGYVLAVRWAAGDVGRDYLTSLGPWVVSPDEWDPQQGQPISITLDGNPTPPGTPESGRWSFEQVLSWASQDADLWPTDLVLGCGDRVSVQPGTELGVSVEGLGALHHLVVRA